MDPVGEHTPGDDDEEDAGPGEEDAQVEAHRTPVERPAEDDGDREPEHGTEEGLCARAGGLRTGPEEEGRLEALAAHGEEGHEQHGPAAGCHGVVEAGVEIGLEMTGGARHPEDHPRDEPDRDDGERAADRFLRLERQPSRTEGQDGPERQGGERGDRDTRPDLGQEIAPAGLHEVGDEDADHEGGLEPFTQADEEVREHGGDPSELNVGMACLIAAVRNVPSPRGCRAAGRTMWRTSQVSKRPTRSRHTAPNAGRRSRSSIASTATQAIARLSGSVGLTSIRVPGRISARIVV